MVVHALTSLNAGSRYPTATFRVGKGQSDCGTREVKGATATFTVALTLDSAANNPAVTRA